MATKKLSKRAGKNMADEECRAKIACERNNFISMIDGEATRQTIAHSSSHAESEGQNAIHLPPASCSTINTGDVAGEIKLMFAPQRYIVYTRFKNAILIHIREYATKTTSSGVCEYPTKKGISLTPGRLFMLSSKLDEIDNQLQLQKFPNPQPSPAYKRHLGGGVYVSTGDGYNCVDLRRYFVPDGQTAITATRSGIALSHYQWNSMKEKLKELMILHSELECALPCMHDAQEEMMMCRECMPFGWLMM